MRAGDSRRKAASAVAALLAPVALAGYALGMWSLGADLGVAGHFGINNGLFSHWQVWIGFGIAATAVAMKLNRYARSGVA
jgi:hypothetical protein